MNYARQCGSPARKETPHSAGLGWPWGWPWPDHPACDHSERSSLLERFWTQQSDLVAQQDQDLVRTIPLLKTALLISDRSRSLKSSYSSRRNHLIAKDTDWKTKALQSCCCPRKARSPGRRIPSTLSSIFLKLYYPSPSFGRML
jgi:hypothetical protein